jgi:hypothetical protein
MKPTRPLFCAKKSCFVELVHPFGSRRLKNPGTGLRPLNQQHLTLERLLESMRTSSYTSQKNRHRSGIDHTTR